MKRVKSVAEEFKKFLLRGNVVDLAVGLLIGTAFNKIVSSLVNDIMLPPIGLLIGKVTFAKLEWVIGKSATDEVLALRYGAFIQSIIDFVLIGLSVFIVVKVMNKLRNKEEEKPAVPEPTKQEQLLMEIRDLLKERNL